jgi:hypothetical protein
MKKFIALVIGLAFSSILANAQTTTVTATITDSDSTVWINPQWSVQFVPNPNFPQLSSYSIGGVAITSSTYNQYIDVTGTGNSSGAISTTLLDNGQVQPAGSTYRWVIQSQTSAPATTYAPVKITGASQSLTTYLSAGAIAPRFPAITNAFGYADAEISTIPQPGGIYFNVVSGLQRIWNGSSWSVNGGGTGIANTTVAVTGATQNANTCSSTTTQTITGLATTSVIISSYSVSASALTGWGSAGGMVFQAYPSAANTLSWYVCNQSTANITYSSITFNVGFK